MDVAMLIGAYTILTVIGVICMMLAFKDRKRPITLSGMHIVFTLVGFGVFTGFMVNLAPQGQPNLFSWWNLSYILYAIAGITTIIAVMGNKLLSMRLPKWLPASYGVLEVLGYAALWMAVIVLL